MTDDVLTLRDHRFACEHVERMIPKFRELFGVDFLEGATIGCPWDVRCPGGRERQFRHIDDQPDDEPPKGIWIEVSDADL